MGKRSREARDLVGESRESADPDFRRRRAGESIDQRALRVLAQRNFERMRSRPDAGGTSESELRLASEAAARKAHHRRRERQARGIADVRTASPDTVQDLRRAGLLP